MSIRNFDLEVRVLSAVDRIRKTQRVEDDFLEIKRSWPDVEKARQLAGSLNRAAGNPVVYVIGIDESTGQVHNSSGVDVLDWWNKIGSQFDQITPELLRHLIIPVDQDTNVVGLLFGSDRAPYVIKTNSPKPSLEIPIRRATGTFTARRDEILRMVSPQVSIPELTTLDSHLSATYFTKSPRNGKDESIGFSGWTRIFIEHMGDGLLTLPAHGISASVEIAGHTVDLSPQIDSHQSTRANDVSMNFISKSPEAVVASGPGSFTVRTQASLDDTDLIDDLARSEKIESTLRLSFLHTPRDLTISTLLTATDRDRHGDEFIREIGDWGFGI